ncbi:unnamed protein product [Peronospora belbahrii]|uniref:Uncharacterized protein n=1 Tax=Peronospora belbahrii TaxID=622444 RepID=A0AAU9KUC8_9STRA|nr:unnamed protein product [Peronospora belbahrii]
MHLARVTDRLPLLLPLGLLHGEDEISSLYYTVVKIRPTLVHVLVNSRVVCIIRSNVPIRDVTDYYNNSSKASYRLLIAVADGNVWIVTLPASAHVGTSEELLTDIVLERSSSERNTSGMAQWFCQLPGVQFVQSCQSGLTSLTLMTSVVAPTTLTVSIRGTSESKLQRYQSLELHDLEVGGVVAILQGDLDGSVRFSLVSYPCKEGDVTKVSVIRSGTLVQMDEPVVRIVPFASATPFTLALEGNVATGSSTVFDALLFLGARGRVGTIHLKGGCLIETLPVSLKKLDLGCAVQSLAFIASLKVFVFCSNGSAYVFRSNDVLKKAQFEDAEGRCNDLRICAEKMPFQPGILRLATHDSTHDMSMLFASGRVITITESLLRAKVSSVLLPDDKQRPENGLSSVQEPMSDSHIRNLLHRIAQTSTESTALRTQSKQLDCQLKMLHSAFELLQIVKAKGVDSVITCDLRASLVLTGTYLELQTVKLMCFTRFANPDVIVSLDEWWLCMHVRTRECAVVTHSFPLNDVLTCGEQSIILDPEMVALQDQGFLSVSCSMVFCPIENGLPDTKHCKSNCIEFKPVNQENMASIAIPLLQNRRFLFAQLSQPVEEETPVSQVAVHSALRQNHESLMPVGRKIKKGRASSSPLWSGVQWWEALADHARKKASFATLWAKISPPGTILAAPTPPSRFVISIPSFFAAEGEEEDEDLEKIRNERMVSFLCHLLERQSDEELPLRRSCRTQHGKLWTALRSISGGLVLLRFTPSEGHERSVDISIQCSDLADLSAMRALVMEKINKRSDKVMRGTIKDDQREELVRDMSEMLEPIAALDNLLELTQKTATSIVDPQSAICTDEVLHAISQLAHLETQTLTLYWKTRLLLNSTII